ncbi:MAG: hybrid sensor histidine kinase/response regulator [Candidatus Kapabacteria bacterium]|jgi:signal transduction histidine kinase|nr:hybrid sensor histidine kinase/response regulator [Candidatus Kapabacteria bacterium]
MESTSPSLSSQSSAPPVAVEMPQSLVDPKDTWILIADDLQDNLNIVKAVLGYKGYNVETAKNGKQVLEQAAKRVPHLILLDIQMPEMNGFDACRQLKANPQFRDVPIIFLTAKVESYDVVDGFKLGAVDYITKPFNTLELLARVHTHLELKHARDLLTAKNKYLEVITNGLTKLNNEKNTFIEIAAHDLKSPLSTIKGLAEFLRRDSELPVESMKVMLWNIVRSSERMFSIIRNLLDVSVIEEGNFRFDTTPVDVEAMLLDLIDIHSHYSADIKNIRFALNVQENFSAKMKGNSDSLLQVFDNLISNALKYSPPGTTVTLTLSKQNNRLRCEIHNEGEGLTDEDIQTMFTKFAKLSVKPTGDEASTGLGLYIAQKFTQAMNGVISCQSAPGEGSTFILEFPALPE